MSAFTKTIREHHKQYYGWRDEHGKEPDYRQYKEKEALHLFMQYRFKMGYVKYEDAAQYIRKHIEGHDYTNTKIPYKKIYEKNCFCVKQVVDEAIKALEDFYDMYYADDKNTSIKSEDKTETKISLEEDAIQGIQNLLELLRRKKNVQFGEQDSHSLEENKEKYKKDIAILRNYMEKGEFGEQEKRSLEENAERWKEDIVILRNYMEQETGGK